MNSLEFTILISIKCKKSV